jgi:hypothetical protein
MPAQQLYSSELNAAPKKVLVESCDVNEESTGIVRVGINYVCKGADLEAVSQGMVLDTEPPLYAQAIFKSQLQRGRLYQMARTYELQYGVGRIRAFYVGVLKRGQEPQLASETETFSFSVPLTFEDIGRLTGNYNGRAFAFARYGSSFITFWETNEARGQNSLATFTISGRSNILRRRYGAIVSGGQLAQSIYNATLEQLIISVQANAQFANWTQNNGNNVSLEPLVRDLLGISPESSVINARTPLQWMQSFPNAWSISGEFDNEFITPSVAVINGTNRIEAESAPSRLPSAVSNTL